MRLSIAVLLVTIAVGRAAGQQAPPAAGGQPAPTTTTAPPLAPPQETTEVRGVVPDLAGRWLVVLHVGPQGGVPGATVIRFWDIAAPGGVPQVHERLVSLPADVAQRRKGVQVWNPTPEDLDAVGRAWDQLAADPERGVATLKTELIDQAHYEDVLKNDEATKNAAWVVRQTFEFERTGGRPVREVSIIAPRKETPTGYDASVAMVMLAMAPFPVPIALYGDAQMYRLAPRRSLLERVLDVFSGCGRTR